MPGPLANPQHEHFCHERAKGEEQLKAYRAAGYRGGANQASRLSADPKIKARIAELLEGAAEKAQIDVAYVLGTIHDTVERCKQAAPVLNRKGERVLVETPEGDVVPAYTFDAGNVLRGAELLGKHLRMFAEKVEHTGKDGGPIEVSDPDLARLIVFQLTKATKQA